MKNKSGFLILLTISICLLIISDACAQIGRFTGKVSDEQGNTIEGAIVVAEYSLGVSGSIEVKTDKNGNFFFRVPDTGIWKITISAEDYNNFVTEIHLSTVNRNEEQFFILKKLGAYEIASPSAENVELFSRARALFHSDNYKEALELLQQFHQDYPNHHLVNYNIGMCLQKLGDYEKAIESYHKALQKRPSDFHTNFQIGECYIELKQIDKALEHFEKTTLINPEDTNNYYNIAEALFYHDNTKECIHYYNKAIEKKPDFADCYLKLGYAYLKINDKANALVSLKKFLELNPQSEKADLINKVINQLIEEQSTIQPQY